MIKIANAPCSWGVLEFDLNGICPGYEQVLDEIKETGYQGTELGDWGFMSTTPGELKKQLDIRGLSMVGAFVPIFLKDRSKHVSGAGIAVRTARLMADAGYPEAFIVLADENGLVKERTQYAGRITPSMSLADDEWKDFCEGANFIAQEVKKETGLRTVFHHHCAGYVETPDEIACLLQNTDSSLIGIVLDTGHYLFGGGDPVDFLKNNKERIWHIHFKDCHNGIVNKSKTEEWDYFKSVGNGVFCELGKGSVNFKAVMEELKKQQYSGWIVVEQDVLPGMGNPGIYARRNRDFIRTLGF